MSWEQEFDAARERFAREGVTTFTDTEEADDVDLQARYGRCTCGSAYRGRITWTLERDDAISVESDAQCGNGHPMGVTLIDCSGDEPVVYDRAED